MDEASASRLPPLPAIRVFEAAARHLSFTKAAAELGMTQAAVSYQIRMLEDRVGAPLFLRLTRRVELTETGARLAPAVTEALARLAGAFAAARDDTGGLLSITTIHTFATNWLVPRLGRFQLAHPGIAVRLDTKEKLVDFTRGDHDIGIRHGMGLWPGLAAHPLMPIEYTALCSPALRDRAGGIEDPRDLLRLPLFWDSGDGYWQRWFAAAGVVVPYGVSDGGMRLENQQMLGRAAQAGQGVALVNPTFFLDELASGELIRPFPFTIREEGSYYLVYLESRRDVPKIAAFRDWLLAEIATDGKQSPAAAE
ncbi:LysR family glycine cleavage system transcriptional activator [Inquilinus ginsengisoli]|uniref:LysR family glycine cleavage system transcriptional activator n=1 Tax=Inquilinus ginsengisoli TaxID=363840 RepID=A0ABU1K161_9PROT|nr:transcriptional regulator GcvA [Inquilinus ginsengisoli]MDR6294602.1 LysR family glycine cleavage system transcriptional activator [Inquilinus ginsengisoli]